MKTNIKNINDITKLFVKNSCIETADRDGLLIFSRLYGFDFGNKNEESQWFSTLTDEEIRQKLIKRIYGGLV